MRLYSALAAGAAAADDDDGSLMGSNEKASFLFVFRFMTLTIYSKQGIMSNIYEILDIP